MSDVTDVVESDESGDQSSDSESGSGFAGQFSEMANRFSVWASANGFDLATSFRDEVRRIIDRYRVQAGDFSGLDTMVVPPKGKSPGLLDREAISDYRLGSAIDPRAFDFVKLDIFAWDRGYRVTSSVGGTHGTFSFHTDGRAIDVGTAGDSPQQIEAKRNEFTRFGLRIYDETDTSNWTSNTTGFHLHIDTGTHEEVVERHDASDNGLTREDLGIGSHWPLRSRWVPTPPSLVPSAPAGTSSPSGLRVQEISVPEAAPVMILLPRP